MKESEQDKKLARIIEECLERADGDEKRAHELAKERILADAELSEHAFGKALERKIEEELAHELRSQLRIEPNPKKP